MVTQSSAFSRFFPAGSDRGEAQMRQFSELLDRAGVQQPPQQIFITTGAVTLVFWLLCALVMRLPVLLDVLLLPLCAGLCAGGTWMRLKMKLRKRNEQFVQQLELALRLIGSGVRIGLGLRQALTVVIEEMPDPAKHEYMRVIGQTNIGVSVYDALDNLAKRMPGNETMMMARAIRIQSQTGGDLARILEHLANTIKERRRIQRKISALTAEGRASAAILTGLPLFVCAFVSLTQRQMGAALWFTAPGHVALGIVALLEALGVVSLLKILRIDV